MSTTKTNLCDARLLQYVAIFRLSVVCLGTVPYSHWDRIPQTNFGQCGAVNLFFRSLVLVATNAQTTIMASKNHTMETQQQPWYKQKQKIQKFPAIVFRCLQFSWTSVVHSCTTTGKQCIATNGLWEQANSHPSISSSWLKQVAIIFGPVQ